MSALASEGLMKLLGVAVAAYFPLSAPLWLALEKKADRSRAESSIAAPVLHTDHSQPQESCAAPPVVGE